MKSEVYFKKRSQEQEKIMESTFWSDFIEEIQKRRGDAIDRCVKNENINRIQFHQGEVNSIDRILELPEKMLNKWKEEPTSKESSY
jgi:hypothetical protein